MKPALLVPFLLATLIMSAGIPKGLPHHLEYDPDITPPAAFFGFEIGERHLTHAELVGYMRNLARESDRVEIIDYGTSHGHRSLIQLLISSPENLKNAEAIRTEHLKLMDPKKSRRLNLKKMPVVLNLNYSVHGNEASGANTAPLVAFYLAAAEEGGIGDLLDQSVILLDPCLNPDGFDRFAAWTNNNVGRNPNPDPNTREHKEEWPNGRTNYYWFDLNRDWMLLTQPESRARMELYHKWMPNFVLDFHEMQTNATYFFQPGAPGRNHPLIPQSTQELTRKVSRYFSAALDESGSLYYSEEGYDDFYTGKGSTMPDLKGAIGILFEQASARGMIQDSVNGPLSFKFAIQNHLAVSMAVLKASGDLREEFLEHTRGFYEESLETAESAGYAGYQFSSDDPLRAQEFVNILRGHDIEVDPVKDQDAWFIPLQQPHYRYLEALVERRTVFEKNIFYDITAWTLPLAYNLEWEEVEASPELGSNKTEPQALEWSQLGYLVDWRDMNAPRLLFDLMEKEIIVNVAKKPFTYEDHAFSYGTVFVPIPMQAEKADEIHQILVHGAREYTVSVIPVSTYLTSDGIDLGSRNFIRLDTPRILLAASEGVNAYDAGCIWHLLDVLHEYPVTLIDPDRLEHVDLSEYTTLVLPPASEDTYPESLVELLRGWVKKGGTVVCLGSTTVKWAIDKELLERSAKEDGKSDEQPAEDATRRPFAEAADDKALQEIRGAIFNTEIDITHPLAYGFSRDRLPVFVDGEFSLKPSSSKYQTPLVFTPDPLLAGYASVENLKILAGAPAAVVESHGDGAIVLFGHNPSFRAYWRGTEKLLLNAILFGKLMKLED